MQSAITARLCLALALLGALPAALAAPQTVILYGDDDYAPYSYVENGVFKGMYIDILGAAADKMPGYRLVLQPRPWKRGLDALEKGLVFGLFPPDARRSARTCSPIPPCCTANRWCCSAMMPSCKPPARISRTILPA